jgi:hypothetical protein
MAESDWTAFTATSNQALDDGDVSKGVWGPLAAGQVPLHSGSVGTNQFVFALHALQATIGVAGMYVDVSGYDPIPPGKGGSIRGALRRYAAGADYAPMLGFISGTNVQTSPAYFLGLTASDPYQIALRKGTLAGGLDPTGADILRISDESFTSNALWFHLRLDVIINPHGDTVLNVKRNSLTTGEEVDDPNWQDVPGMESFTDDANGILTGGPPLITGGLRGFKAHFNNGAAGRVSLFDHVEFFKQINP